MDLTILVAKVVAIYWIVSGLLLIFRKKLLVAVLKDFFSHPSTVWVTGAILLLASSFLLLTHNIWEGGLNIFVTIVIWLMVIKGAVLLIIPEAYSKINYQRIYTIPLGLNIAAAGVYILMTF
ncbi:MAG: hypothetical protein WC887_03025 [Candidatus Paceibacterota bacterium]|jgi:hypothetical protein